ncbi:hypothetical protein Pelo_13664 [Pelomyxa schiedti]|nr:hypothetical protein Pelo_13664 [Pelomyxa schiedti]
MMGPCTPRGRNNTVMVITLPRRHLPSRTPITPTGNNNQHIIHCHTATFASPSQHNNNNQQPPRFCNTKIFTPTPGNQFNTKPLGFHLIRVHKNRHCKKAANAKYYNRIPKQASNFYFDFVECFAGWRPGPQPLHKVNSLELEISRKKRGRGTLTSTFLELEMEISEELRLCGVLCWVAPMPPTTPQSEQLGIGNITQKKSEEDYWDFWIILGFYYSPLSLLIHTCGIPFLWKQPYRVALPHARYDLFNIGLRTALFTTPNARPPLAPTELAP